MHFDNNINFQNIEISNINGIVLIKSDKRSNANHIDISELKNGLYFIRIKTNNGDYIQKIILNK